MPLSTALFDYNPPAGLIAQDPAARRDRSRLLVVDRSARTLAHRVFSDLPEFLRPGDTLIRNNASVLPARLKARRPTGGGVECFLLAPVDGTTPNLWRCLLKPGRRLVMGATFSHADGAFDAEVVGKYPDGVAQVRFATPGGEPIATVAGRVGEIPLPPYIERPGGHPRTLDRERYQTVYADPARPVAVAAPTAGLHFTPELLAGIRKLGVRTADLTLHVGLGTFRPISTETIEEHPIHREIYEIPAATQRALLRSDPEGASGRRIAVGTTSVRSIEDFLASRNAALEGSWTAETAIYIYPPRAFRGVDALITNFHQPRSTLMCLVAAFLTPGSTGGISWIKEIYAEAIAKDYRLFSYGDAMLIM